MALHIHELYRGNAFSDKVNELVKDAGFHKTAGPERPVKRVVSHRFYFNICSSEGANVEGVGRLRN